MSEVSQPIGFVLFFAPDFLLMQVLHLVGVVRQSSYFARILWSVILSLPVRWLGAPLVTLAGLEIGQGVTFEMCLFVLVLLIGSVLVLVRRLFFFE